MKREEVNQESVRSGIVEAIQAMNISQYQFAQRVGIAPTNFYKKLRGEDGQSFNAKDFEKFGKVGLSKEWLQDRKGEMFKPTVKASTLPTNGGVPVYEESFALGFDKFIDGDSSRALGYLNYPETKNADCWCKATGDSMSPKINNGNFVCLQKLYDWDKFIVYGDIYAVDTFNDMRTIKKIEQGKHKDEFLLVPINEAYTPQSIKKKEIRNLFKVIAKIDYEPF